MSAAVGVDALSLEGRARQSLGASEDVIYEMIGREMSRLNVSGDTVVDVGCGVGNLRGIVRARFRNYIGVDAVRYEQLGQDVDFHGVDLNAERIPLPDGTVDAAVSVETIEHLENPRAFVRELARVVKPGGWVFLTTPNQLSLLSLLTLILKQRFSAFQDNCYPAHITPLLEVDLRRIAAECGLKEVFVRYSGRGRIVMTPWHYPRFISRIAPRVFSDNVLLAARRTNP